MNDNEMQATSMYKVIKYKGYKMKNEERMKK